MASAVAVLVGALVLVGGAFAATPRQHTAHPLPELRIGHSEVTFSGGKLSGVIDVRNSGGAAPASTLSITFRLRAHTLKRGLKSISTPAIGADQRTVLHVNVSFGSGRGSGVYVIEACVDSAHKVAESDEADNCKHIVLAAVGSAKTSAGSTDPGAGDTPDDTSDDTSDDDGTDDTPDDTTPPDTFIDTAPSGLVPDGPKVITFHASEAGATFECATDGGLWGSCASPFTVPPLGDGAHTIAVRASDAAGNPDLSPATASWTTPDTTPPTTIIDSGPPSSTTESQTEVVFHSSESGSTFMCNLDFTDWLPCVSPYDFNERFAGDHNLKILATDAAGNQQTNPTVISWTIVN